jgi:hypothetical protein
VIQLDVRADIRQVERYYKNLRRNAVKKAAARAINDTLITLRAEGARMIKQDHPALKIGDIKNNMTLKRAHYHNLRGMVATKGKPLSALLFRPTGGRKTKRGTTPVSIMFGTSRGVVAVDDRKGFRIPRFGNEVFVRRFGKGRQVRRFRGPSMPGVFRAQGFQMKALAELRWTTAFGSRMRYEIELAKRGV